MEETRRPNLTYSGDYDGGGRAGRPAPVTVRVCIPASLFQSTDLLIERQVQDHAVCHDIPGGSGGSPAYDRIYVFGNQAGIGPGNRAGQRAVYARALRL